MSVSKEQTATLPPDYLEAMKDQLGSEYEQFIQSFSGRVRPALRINTAKIKQDEYCKISPWDLEPVPWTANGYYYEDACTPAKHPHYYAGLYYLQEPSAMTPADRLPITPGDHVLDLCAAPGGKATELAAKLKGKGFLLANDISNSRAKALLKNLELHGAPNIFVTSETPEKLLQHYSESFDKILLDAPCSGEGMFRKEPRMAEHWEQHGPAYYQRLQEQLIEQAFTMLKPGGMMLYSTCTFSVMENEAVIWKLKQEHPEMILHEIAPYDGFSEGICYQSCEELKKCVHIYPHKMNGEGHFLALLSKAGVAVPEQNGSGKRSARIPKEAAEFLSLCNYDFSEGSFYQQGEKLYYLNPDMQIKQGLRYLRTGLLIGTCGRNRFEPSQAFAMALKKEQFSSVIDFSSQDDRVIRYLKGETLHIPDIRPEGKGNWQLICVDGFPLGFGKRAGDNLKNKYYAGWRWQ